MLAFAAPQFLFDRLSILPTLFQFRVQPPDTYPGNHCWHRFNLETARAWHCAFGGVPAAFVHHHHLWAPQTVEYALPAWVLLTVILAEPGSLAEEGDAFIGKLSARAIPRLTTSTPKYVSALLVIVVGVILIHDGATRLPSFVELAADRSTRDTAQAVLTQAAADSVVLSEWHQATPMWALQDVEGLRRDIDVRVCLSAWRPALCRYICGSGAGDGATRTTYLTSYYATSFAARDLHTAPLNPQTAWQVVTTPIQLNHDQAGDDLLFDNRLQVQPLQLQADKIETGQVLQLIVDWRSVGQISANESLTVRMMRPDGRLAANADLRLDPATPLNQWQSQRLALGVPLDMAPGAYKVLVGMYQSGPAGFAALKERSGDEFAAAAQMTVVPASQPELSMHTLGWVAGNQSTLIGVSFDTGIPGRLRVLTNWQLSDISGTFSLQDAAGSEVAAPQRLPAATSAGRYFTLIFDAPAIMGLRIVQTDPVVSVALPDFSAGERFIPFADQIALMGSSTSRVGDQLKVDLYWVANRPIMTDYVVSARVAGAGFQAAHDGVPALGALPTLKWIRGSQITDRHPIDLGNYRGPLAGTVLVYDSFTQQLLPALDERYEHGITFDVAP